MIAQLIAAGKSVSSAEREYYESHTDYVIDSCEAPVTFFVEKNLSPTKREKVLQAAVEEWQDGIFVVTGFDHDNQMIRVARSRLRLCCVS